MSNIVLWMEQGQSPEEIILGYPQLTLADVHSAMAYYFDNREEMDRLLKDDAAFVEQIAARHGANLDAVTP